MNKADAATIVRAIMKSHSKWRVFNNLYKSGTRTVKCYGRAETSAKMVDEISRTLKGLGVPFNIKFSTRENGNFYSGGPGIIVRLV